MSLNNIAESAKVNIESALVGVALTDPQKSELSRIIDDAIRAAADHCCETHREVTLQCCGPEADMAHKIAEEARKKTDVLISNLMAMR